MLRINRLEIKGFRAFGSQAQVLEFRGPMAVVWGPNSQGKTSIAEAIEFLLTGKTVRRELVASAKREFAEALRNAYLPQGEEVKVSADFADARGQVHRVERRLTRDYTGRDPCQSELTVDGRPASDLTTLGIRLSQPPLEAPVLMPHTLRYVVSAEPQQRTEYFKAVLEVSDLEEIRNAISDAKDGLSPPFGPIENIYQQCRSHPQFGPLLAPLEEAAPSRAVVENALARTLHNILADAGPMPGGLEAQLSAAKALLEQRRAQAFPVNDLVVPREPWEPSWGSRPDVLQSLSDFIRARSALQAEVSRLIRLFEELLKVPEIATATAPLNCPVCETRGALTPERIARIRSQLEANSDFRTAREGAERVLRELRSLAEAVAREAKNACPPFLKWSDAEASQNQEKMAELLLDRADELMAPWKAATSELKAALNNLEASASDLGRAVGTVTLEDLNDAKVQDLDRKLTELFQRASDLAEALRRYRDSSDALVDELKQEIDRRAGMAGWKDLIHLAEQREELLRWLVDRWAHREVVKEVDRAIEQIDEAKAEILDEKFAELGQEIVRWWNLLRPDEPTSFDGIQRGGTGRRFIDLKARLTVPGASTSGVLRDAVAVFSDSQLNCLGLAAFLARTVREGAGFVVLDDPVPASDEEHRAFFIDRVLEELIKSNIQVILLTHDERMWKDVQERYKHLDIDTFLVTLGDPQTGAVVEKRSDTLDALIARATPYIENSNPEIRKIGAQRLRDATERFCKLVLVKHRKDEGDLTANVSDYDGKTLGDLIPKVEPLLNRDPSHPGKLRVIGKRLNPGTHDDRVPPPGDLKQCFGELKVLKKEYLP